MLTFSSSNCYVMCSESGYAFNTDIGFLFMKFNQPKANQEKRIEVGVTYMAISQYEVVLV